MALITENGGQALRTVEFYTTIAGENEQSEPKLAQVKGVDAGYPQYGELLISDINGEHIQNSTDKQL